MAGYFGLPRPFYSQTQKWSSYQIQFEHFLRANDINQGQCKEDFVPYCSHGTKTYKILKGLMFPDKKADSNTTALFQKLTTHFEPK